MKTQVYTIRDAITIECEKNNEGNWFDITQDVLPDSWQAFLNTNFPSRNELSIDVYFIGEMTIEPRTFDYPGGVSKEYYIEKVKVCVPGALGCILLTITPKTHKTLVAALENAYYPAIENALENG